jgi:hypothetical protein
MKQFSGRPLFLFFTDDIAWCRAVFRGRSVQVCEETDTIRAFALMSSCDHFVIANSTYSWWAAWLGERSGTRVFTPRHDQWFGPVLLERYRTHDIIPSRRQQPGSQGEQRWQLPCGW